MDETYFRENGDVLAKKKINLNMRRNFLHPYRELTVIKEFTTIVECYDTEGNLINEMSNKSEYEDCLRLRRYGDLH